VGRHAPADSLPPPAQAGAPEQGHSTKEYQQLANHLFGQLMQPARLLGLLSDQPILRLLLACLTSQHAFAKKIFLFSPS
jgi:hypothetical protein